MSRRVIWDQAAVEQLLELARTDRAAARRIAVGVRSFAAGGRADVKKLAGRPGEWRLREGDWRVVFAADPDTSSIIVPKCFCAETHTVERNPRLSFVQ